MLVLTAPGGTRARAALVLLAGHGARRRYGREGRGRARESCTAAPTAPVRMGRGVRDMSNVGRDGGEGGVRGVVQGGRGIDIDVVEGVELLLSMSVRDVEMEVLREAEFAWRERALAVRDPACAVDSTDVKRIRVSIGR